MSSSATYIAMSIVFLAIIAFLLFFLNKTKKSKNNKKLTPLAGLAFGFIIAGIVFGDSKFLGYGLIAAGVILAVIDMILKLRKK